MDTHHHFRSDGAVDYYIWRRITGRPIKGSSGLGALLFLLAILVGAVAAWRWITMTAWPWLTHLPRTPIVLVAIIVGLAVMFWLTDDRRRSRIR